MIHNIVHNLSQFNTNYCKHATFFTYSPQDSVGIKTDTTLNVGEPFSVTVSVGGTENQYQWMKDGSNIDGADSSTYVMNSIDVSDAGSYVCKISNTIATELTLYSRPVNLSVDDPAGLSENNPQNPSVFHLHQNSPNPFNPITIISYELPTTNEVDLSIYNLLGQKMITLISEKKPAGTYNVEWDASEFASGVFYYRLEAGEFEDVKKMILLR